MFQQQFPTTSGDFAKVAKEKSCNKTQLFFLFFRGFVAFLFHSTGNRNNVALHFVPLTVQGRTSPAFDCGKSLSLLNKLPTPICFLLENSVFTMFQQQLPTTSGDCAKVAKEKSCNKTQLFFLFLSRLRRLFVSQYRKSK